MCEKYSRGCWFVFMNIFKFVLYVADVVTDIMLAVDYYRNGDNHWFGLTLVFALVPQFIMNMTVWYQEGRKPCTFIFYFLQIGVALKYLQLVFGVCFCHNQIDEYDPEFIRRDRAYSISLQDGVTRTVHHILPLAHLIGSLLESVPQICLQIHVIIVTGKLERMEIEPLKYVSIFISLVAALKTVWDWEMHYLHDKESSILLLYGPLFAIWKIVELCSRIVAISVFSSLSTYGVIAVVSVHWLVMAILESMCRYGRCCSNDDFWVNPDHDFYSRSGKYMQICFILFIVSPFDVLAWANFGSRSLTGLEPFVNGALTLLGNYMMALVWYFCKDVSAWYDLYALILVLTGTAIAVLLLKPLYLMCYACGLCPVIKDELEALTSPNLTGPIASPAVDRW